MRRTAKGKPIYAVETRVDESRSWRRLRTDLPYAEALTRADTWRGECHVRIVNQESQTVVRWWNDNGLVL